MKEIFLLFNNVNTCRRHIVRCILIDFRSQSLGWRWYTWKSSPLQSRRNWWGLKDG